MRRICEEMNLTPQFEDRPSFLVDLNNALNIKYNPYLPTAKFGTNGELKEIRNAIVHGNIIDEGHVESGLMDLIDIIIKTNCKLSKLKI